MSTYTLLNRYPTSGLLKVAALQALTLLLHLAALPLMVLVLLVERAAEHCTITAGSVPTLPTNIIATTTGTYLHAWRTQ